MVKQYTLFGYDLKTGSQIIAVITGVTSILMVPIFYYGTFGDDFMVTQVALNPDLKNYGGSTAFRFLTGFFGTMELIYAIICIKLFLGIQSNDALLVRVWIKSSVISICCFSVFGTYLVVLVTAAGPIATAVGGVIFLVVAIPTKIYFTLVVNSYHNEIARNHYWGPYLNIFSSVPYVYSGPSTCQLVPQIQSNRPTVVIVS